MTKASHDMRKHFYDLIRFNNVELLIDFSLKKTLREIL